MVKAASCTVNRVCRLVVVSEAIAPVDKAAVCEVASARKLALLKPAACAVVRLATWSVLSTAIWRDDKTWMKHTLSFLDDGKKSVDIDYRPVHTYTMSNDIQYIEPKARVY